MWRMAGMMWPWSKNPWMHKASIALQLVKKYSNISNKHKRFVRLRLIHMSYFFEVLVVSTTPWYIPILLKAQAGIPKQLASSAVYPRGFGRAIADLMPLRGERVQGTVDFENYKPGDDLGALDDFRKGNHKTWWRGLWVMDLGGLQTFEKTVLKFNTTCFFKEKHWMHTNIVHPRFVDHFWEPCSPSFLQPFNHFVWDGGLKKKWMLCMNLSVSAWFCWKKQTMSYLQWLRYHCYGITIHPILQFVAYFPSSTCSVVNMTHPLLEHLEYLKHEQICLSCWGKIISKWLPRTLADHTVGICHFMCNLLLSLIVNTPSCHPTAGLNAIHWRLSAGIALVIWFARRKWSLMMRPVPFPRKINWMEVVVFVQPNQIKTRWG